MITTVTAKCKERSWTKIKTPYSPFVILMQVWRTRYQCFEVGQQHQMPILGVTKVNHLVLAADVLYMYVNTYGGWSLWYISKQFQCYTFDDVCFQMYTKQYHETRRNKLHWKYIWDIMYTLSSMHHTLGNLVVVSVMAVRRHVLFQTDTIRHQYNIFLTAL